jgi:hypothetical protein
MTNERLAPVEETVGDVLAPSGIPQVANSTDPVEVVFERRHAAVLQA